MVVIAVASLVFAVVITQQEGDQGDGSTAAMTAEGARTGGGVVPSSTGGVAPPAFASGAVSGLLLVNHGGTMVVAALVHARPDNGVVLGLPGSTLLRSGDAFSRLEDLGGPAGGAALAKAVGDALEMPIGGVASVDWAGLRALMANAGVKDLPSDRLEAGSVAAAQVVAALASFLTRAGSEAEGVDWDAAALGGDPAGFTLIIKNALAITRGAAWMGRVLEGEVVKGGGVTYLEPDVQKARDLLVGARTGG